MTKARDISKLLSTANGKIAGENLDVSFENITDTGTQGTRVATGTTAQRGSTTGQLRFNTTTGLAEYYTGTAFKTIDAPPTVSSVGNNNITQTDIDSGYDLSISGSGFSSGATVKFIGNDGTEYNSPTVTVNSDTSITARVNSSLTNANEPYDITVTNTSGLSNTLADAFNVDGKPAWNTASGQVGGNIYETDSVSVSLSATDPEGGSVTYSETTSNLSPQGLTLGSNGIITGTAPSVASDTTISFTARASDGTNTADRNFNIIIKNDLTNVVDYFGDGSGVLLMQMDNSLATNNASYTASGSGAFSTDRVQGSHSYNVAGNGDSIGNPITMNSNPMGSYPLTVSVWASSDNWTNSNPRVFTNGNLGGVRLSMVARDGYLRIQYGGSSHWWTSSQVISGFNSNNTTFYHFVFSVVGFNNSSHAIYLNGVSQALTDQGGTHGGSAGFVIGGDATGTEKYNGKLDQYRIFNKALSASEALSLYNYESARFGV